ncbi:MAG: hypothetical protein ACK5V1_21185 [Planctomycetaceae bacterium]|jgi:hypothetical protein
MRFSQAISRPVRRHSLCGLLWVWGFLLSVAPLAAAPVSFELRGRVTSATTGNGFGLSVGDPLLMSGVYDSADYDGTGYGQVLFNQASGNTFTITLGSVTLTNAMDVQYTQGFPVLYFHEGQVWYPDFGTDIGVNGAPVDYAAFTEATFEAVFSTTNLIEGEWDVVPIPEPDALALAGWLAPWLLTTALHRARVGSRGGSPGC